MRDYTSWTKHCRITPEQLAEEREWNRQRDDSQAAAQASILRYEQECEGRHDGAELLTPLRTKDSRKEAA